MGGREGSGEDPNEGNIGRKSIQRNILDRLISEGGESFQRGSGKEKKYTTVKIRGRGVGKWGH